MSINGRGATKLTIGWREWVALPDLGIPRIKVKIDTGARSSAIHASHFELFRKRGTPMVRFHVAPLQRTHEAEVVAEAPVADERWVTNSGGHRDRRLVIETRVRFLERTWPIELTLARRDSMGFRMLLGRQAVRGLFVVDPGRSYLGGRPPRKKRKKPKGRKSP